MVDRKWLKKQADKVRKVDYIDPALYRKYGVKRGLRNDNGTDKKGSELIDIVALT